MAVKTRVGKSALIAKRPSQIISSTLWQGPNCAAEVITVGFHHLNLEIYHATASKVSTIVCRSPSEFQAALRKVEQQLGELGMTPFLEVGV